MADNNFENEKELNKNEANINENSPEEIEEEYVQISIDSVFTEDKEDKEDKPKKKSALREALDWVMSIAVAVLVVMLLNMFVFIQVVVDGSSMYPTLNNGDRLIATRFLYTPEAEDIVVVEPYLQEGSVKGKLMFGRTLYIKRVVATEGQTIDLKNGKVYIDGELYEEDYIPEDVRTFEMSTELPLTVPENSVFVMGDNRENSKDSRDKSVGIIRNEQVVGKAVLRILPVKDFGVVK